MVSRRTALIAAACAVAAVVGIVTVYGVRQPEPCAAGATLNIVAHQDDDLLFQNPDVLHDIQAGRCVRTVYVTAGDANDVATYWKGRETGAQAAYAQMAGVADTWTTADAEVPGHPIPLRTLADRPQVSLAFMRLPDGGTDGKGGSRNGFASLQKLDDGGLPTIRAVDGSSQYTEADLIAALATLIDEFRPTRINTLDFAGAYGDGDHSDHHAVAYLVREADNRYTSPHTVNGYQGYGIVSRPENVSGSDLTAKRTAFLTYSRFDPATCATDEACAGRPEAQWWHRQYSVGGVAGSAPPGNVASTAVATASSEDTATGQTASKAVDGVADGYPGDVTREWASAGGTTGSWLDLTWNGPVTIDHVVLHDRPNGDDDITAGTLTFSDGSSVAVGALDPGGAATTVNFPARTVTSLRFTVSAVSDATRNTGLSEIEVSAAAGGVGARNVARSAAATASSHNAVAGQTADKAVDGVVDGHPVDNTREWATQVGRTGSWLNLTWDTPLTVDRVVLHDRPNRDDDITAGTLTFSDGSSVAVGPLDPTGAATTVDFPARSITSLRFTVTAVSGTTRNTGLAEMEVRAS
jgi:LmbE family N-acetylglucosaminyl deacetylase